MKLKERLIMAALGFSLAVVLLVLLDMNLVIPHTGHSGGQHGRVRMGRRERLIIHVKTILIGTFNFSDNYKSRILQKTPGHSQESKLVKSEENEKSQVGGQESSLLNSREEIANKSPWLGL